MEHVLVPRRSTPLLWFGIRAAGAPTRLPTQPTPYHPNNAQILAPGILQTGVEVTPSSDISRLRASSRPARPRQRQPVPRSNQPRRPPRPRLSQLLQYVSSRFLLVLFPPLSRRVLKSLLEHIYIIEIPFVHPCLNISDPQAVVIIKTEIQQTTAIKTVQSTVRETVTVIPSVKPPETSSTGVSSSSTTSTTTTSTTFVTSV